MIAAKRPGIGIKANELNLVIGKKAKVNIPKNKILNKRMFR